MVSSIASWDIFSSQWKVMFQPITWQQILDSSKPKEFADDNFKFHENGRKLSYRVEKYCGKRRNCSLRAISPFSTGFSIGLFPRGVKRCHCVGMGQTTNRICAIGIPWYLDISIIQTVINDKKSKNLFFFYGRKRHWSVVSLGCQTMKYILHPS